MNIQRQKICDLPMVYVTAELKLGGRRYLAVASEAPGEHAYIIDPETGEYAELWQGDTGVMNILQIPGQERLLAITKFYPVFQSRQAAVCLLTPPADGNYLQPWTIREIAPLPFCHRIGVFESRNGLFLLGCQLCHDKACQEDWSQPGALWTAPIPDGDGPWTLSMLYDGLTKNHGLWIDGGAHVYICAENGVLRFDLSDYRTGEYRMPTLVTTTPTSDMSLTRLGGRLIAGTIEPFHGDRLGLYEAGPDTWHPLAAFDIAFGHVVWVGDVFGRPAALAGSRGGDRKQLELIFWETGERVTLEEGVGPTQASVYRDGDAVRILAANHGSGQVTLYTLTA